MNGPARYASFLLGAALFIAAVMLFCEKWFRDPSISYWAPCSLLLLGGGFMAWNFGSPVELGQGQCSADIDPHNSGHLHTGHHDAHDSVGIENDSSFD